MNHIVTTDELEKVSHLMIDEVVRKIKENTLDRFQKIDQNIIINFNCYHLKIKWRGLLRVIIYYNEEHTIYICENEQCKAYIEEIIERCGDKSIYLHSFFLELIRYDTDFLDLLETDITETEDDLLATSNYHFTAVIISYRRQLLYLKRYYEQLNYIMEAFVANQENDSNKEELLCFKLLENRLERLYLNTVHLRDYVTQVREAYQSQIDIEQNNLMKIFTVVTTIFLPLTLLVGWYGMNLQMPEYSWRYGYLFVVILSIMIVIVCFKIFKSKKWL